MHVQHTAPEAAVLHELTRRDEVQRDAFAFSPLGQRQRDGFWPVVQTQLGCGGSCAR